MLLYCGEAVLSLGLCEAISCKILSAPCCERHDSLSRTRSVRHSRCYTITRRNRKKRPVRLSVPVATTVEQSSCSSLCPHSNALTSNSQLLLCLHLWPDQLANVAVALELVAALRTARAVCERENAPVRKRLYSAISARVSARTVGLRVILGQARIRSVLRRGDVRDGKCRQQDKQ